jgi:hypothetical protein
LPTLQIVVRNLAPVTFLHVVGLNCTGGNPTGNAPDRVATASSVIIIVKAGETSTKFDIARNARCGPFFDET